MSHLTDTYQTEGRLSYTAAFISLKYIGLYKETAYRKSVIPELEFYYSKIENQRYHTILHLLSTLLSQNSLRRMLKNLNEFVLPGDLNHIALRKWYMFQQIKQLQDDHKGLNVVLLGSGLDPLTHYLADSNSNNLLFELDSKPVVHIRKSAGFSFNRIRAYNTVSDLLKNYSTCQNPALPSVFVTEGFWDYSTDSQIKKIISRISEISHSETYLLTTYFNFPRMNSYDSDTIQTSTAFVGERISNQLSLQQFSEYLEAYGFKKQTHLTAEKLKKQLHEWDLGQELIDEFHLISYKKTRD